MRYLFITLFLFAFSSVAAVTQDINTRATEPAPVSHKHTPDDAPDSQAVYSGVGTIKAWREDSVSVAHKAIPALHWPAMTMSFSLAGYQGKPLPQGQQVNFTFRQSEAGYVLVSISAK